MWLLAVNPTSGKGKGALFGREVAGKLTQRGERYELVTANSATQLISNLRSTILRHENIKGVISVGGDGLAHLVLQHCVPQNIPVAPIPAGTGNDLVRTLGWNLKDVDEFIDKVCTTAPQRIDLGLVDGEWFANILSTGFDSIVNERANRISWPSGPARYNIAIALELPLFKPRRYRLDIDNETLETQAMLIAVANGISYGGGMKVAPHASVHDGLFDLVILKPVSKIEFLKVFPKVYVGEHLSHPAVEVRRCKKVTLTAEAIAYSDGERVGQLPVTAECIPDAVLTWLI